MKRRDQIALLMANEAKLVESFWAMKTERDEAIKEQQRLVQTIIDLQTALRANGADNA